MTYGIVAVLAFLLAVAFLAWVTTEAPRTSLPSAPSVAAPTYNAPTYTTPGATSAPAAEPEAAPQTFTGIGDQVVRLSAPRDYAVVSFDCTSCSGNVVVKADGALLVNEIGRYSGKTLYGLTGASTSSPLTRLQINAKGRWSMTVGGLTTARQVPSLPSTGNGDDVLLISAPKDAATLSHKGKSNFAVWAASQRGGVDLVVNEIGRYDGTVILPADGGALLVVINADGTWSLS